MAQRRPSPSDVPLRPHRCNDRLEDAIEGLFEGAPRENFFPLLRLLFECVAAEPGQEPTTPYRFVKPLPPGVAPPRRPAYGSQQAAARAAAAAAASAAAAAPAPAPAERAKGAQQGAGAAAAAAGDAAAPRRGWWSWLWGRKAA